MQQKRKFERLISEIALIFLTSAANFTQAISDKEVLQGLWQAKGITVDGKEAPSPEAANMLFTFKKDKLSIKGNFHNGQTINVDYALDSAQTPKHLNIIVPSQSAPILAIYELSGDTFKICFRKSTKAVERPLKLESSEGSGLTLIVFNRQKI